MVLWQLAWRTVLLLQVVPKRIMMSQERRLQINSCFYIFMLRLFVTWVLRYAAHTYSTFGHPCHMQRVVITPQVYSKFELSEYHACKVGFQQLLFHEKNSIWSTYTCWYFPMALCKQLDLYLTLWGNVFTEHINFIYTMQVTRLVTAYKE